jgi:uncharacterized protein
MRIPVEALEEKTIQAVIEEFVSRDGTDLTDCIEKVKEVRDLLKRGEAHIVFDGESQTCNIVLASER